MSNMNYKLFLVLLLTISFNFSFGQLLIEGDNMESTSIWRGASTTGLNSSFIGGFSNNVDNPPNYQMYSSFDTCYQIRGLGLGSSTIEKDTFLYPNIILRTGRQYQIRYKLASFGLNPSTQTAAGVDAPDWIELQYTVNNGLSWWRDAQIQGISNSMWAFDGAIGTGAQLNIVRTGSMSTTTPTVYVSNFNGPIVSMTVNLPVTNINQLRLRFVTNINATGETFMLDDVEIWDMSSTLPVELAEFNCKYYKNGIKIFWYTLSEINNDHFELFKSKDGFNFFKIATIQGRGNTNEMTNYEYVDYGECDSIVYYKLKQVDYDGLYDEYGPIAFKCRHIYTPNAFYDILGREIKQDYEGIKIQQK